jgi:hypothetical protein
MGTRTFCDRCDSNGGVRPVSIQNGPLCIIRSIDLCEGCLKKLKALMDNFLKEKT